MVASYMARARGSGEPELSITRVKDLEQLLRECRAFQMDHAHEYSTPENGLGDRLEDLRRRFEELLGNASGYVAVGHPHIPLSSSELFLKGEETLARRNHIHSGRNISEMFLLVSWTIGLSVIPIIPLSTSLSF